jgi:hypothetical protein
LYRVRGAVLTYDLSYVSCVPSQFVSPPAARIRDETATMALLATLIRGQASDLATGRSPQAVSTAAMRHGVLPLLYAGLGGGPGNGSGDALDPLRTALAMLARTEAAVDAIRVAACRKLLQALHENGVPVLVFKGGALAFSHYPRSDLRARDDTDLLVEESDLAVLDSTMRDLGYRQAIASSGELVSQQRLYTLIDTRQIHHNVDVHWRISNRHRYARMFDLGELLDRSRTIPGWTSTARCPCPVDALLIAALHRASHRGTDRLVWLYDIHRLLAAMDDDERHVLEERALTKGLMDEYQQAVAGAHYFFGEGGQPPRNLARGVRTIDIWLADLRALPSWRARMALLKEHAFPPGDYMRRMGAGSKGLNLPTAYLARGLRGSLKLFRRA